VRTSADTAALEAPYTPKLGDALRAAIDEVTITEEPAERRGSIFCSVKSTPQDARESGG
jgi:hypothetical protein